MTSGFKTFLTPAPSAELVARGHDEFGRDRAVRLAIERLLEIIGEAANALSQGTRSRFPAVDWAGITRLRIVLAHHYHRVDAELVWTMASEEIPALVCALGSPGPLTR